MDFIRKSLFLCALFFLCIKTVLAFGIQDELISPASPKELKTLVLIIASDGNPAYIELQKIWRSYMLSDPEHFEVYFIRGNPDLETPYEIQDSNLTVKTAESYIPGIVNKTVLSIEALMPRLKEFDYVIRTNLSSFYVFPQLLAFLKTLPRTNCYSAFVRYTPAEWHPKFGKIVFGSGCGMILSRDLAERLVEEKEEIFKYNTELPDDVLIGLFFQTRKIRPIAYEYVEFSSLRNWYYEKNKIKPASFHFRAKSNYNVRSADENYAEEIYINRALLQFYYPEAMATLNKLSPKQTDLFSWLKDKADSLPNPQKKIFAGVIIKNDDKLIPDFLKSIANLGYDKHLIDLQIDLYNQNPAVKAVVTDWIEKHKNLYSQIALVDHQLATDFAHDAQRFKHFAEIKNSYLSQAQAVKADYCLIVESDVFLAPIALKHLVNQDKAIIAPLLLPLPHEATPWRNFWADATENGFYKDHPDYAPIARCATKGTFKVACVSGAYVIKTEAIKDLSFSDGKDGWEFMAFSANARNRGIDQFVCNDVELGRILHFNSDLSEAELRQFSLFDGRYDVNEYLFYPQDQPLSASL